MASVLVDAGFLVALLSRRDANHRWAAAQSPRLPPPWMTCEAALSEAFHLLGARGSPSLVALLRRRALICPFHFDENTDADVPMSFADACLVRMTEIMNDPILLTCDSDFRVYRRHGRQAIPCVIPG
jgi:uncharacterized protein